MTYTGYDGINARGALAISKDLKNFKRHGLIVPAVTYSKFVYWAEKNGMVSENYYRNHKFYYQEAAARLSKRKLAGCLFITALNLQNVA